ncbi:MAG: glycosyltransferase family 4 protein [Saprospiraceae bacterium]|nr:glycosyltransferase family 4 protein [Saprospiraceae bacterium]
MKILFVLESFYPNIGGVETLFKSLVEELSAEGHEVMVITTHPGGNIPKKETFQNITIRRYRFHNRYLFTFFAFIPVLWYAGRYDLVHTTSYNAGIPAFIGAWLRRRKTIITFHEYWGQLWFQLPYFSRISLRLHYLFEWILVQIPFHRFIAVSDYTKKCLEKAGVPPKKVVRIYNGIDYTQWQPNTVDHNSKFTFIYFGRLGISKGLDMLLEATKILSETHSDFRLLLILPTKPESLYAIIQEYIHRFKLEHSIQIINHLSQVDLLATISTADAVVIPSYSEGFCYSAVESVALGKPLISSGRGALPEVVSGKFIQLEEFSASSLCDAMHKGMQGEWTETESRVFPLRRTVENYIALYKEMLTNL